MYILKLPYMNIFFVKCDLTKYASILSHDKYFKSRSSNYADNDNMSIIGQFLLY